MIKRQYREDYDGVRTIFRSLTSSGFMLKKGVICCSLLLSIGEQLHSQHFSTFPLNQEKQAYAEDVEARALAGKDSSLLAEAYYLYGKVYAMAGDYRSSQRYFLSSYRIQEALQDTSAIARLSTRLSENENSQGHFPEAIRYARQAVAYAEKTRDRKRMAPASAALGKVFERLWESGQLIDKVLYDSAHYYYNRALAFLIDGKDEVGIAEANMMLGYLKLKNKDREAISLLEKSVNVLRSSSQLFAGVTAGAYLASAYLHFGELEKGKRWLELSHKFYEENALNDFNVYVLILESWKEYYLKSGNLQLAMVYSEKIRVAEKEQFLADRSQTLDKLDQELKAGETEEKLRLQQQRTGLLVKNFKLQQKINISLLIATIISFMAGFLLYRLYRNNRRLSILNANLVEEQSHRLKNHLQMATNLLSLQSGEIKDEEALDAIQKSRLRLEAIALLQKKLYASGTGAEAGYVDFSSYGQELLELALDACGYSGVNRQVYIAPVKLKIEVALSLSLVLNELITNACKYAFPGNPSPFLRVEFRQNGRRLSLLVEDNGREFDRKAFLSNPSFGVQLIRILAEQLYADYDFQKDSDTGGLVFKMEFS